MAKRTDKPGKPRSSLAALFAVLAFIACNGTILLVALLSTIGVTIVINPHLQAAAISLFAVIALLLVFRDFRSHRVRGPLLVCAIATIALIGTMYIHFNKILESAGLLALFAAVLWNWKINRPRCDARMGSSDD